MSIAEQPPSTGTFTPEHGDGITIVFEEKGENTIVKARDSVRNCEKILTLPTRTVTRRRDAVRNHILYLLAEDLNDRPMQVGVFSNGHKNDSATMPQ